jgi:hypothetical protein
MINTYTTVITQYVQAGETSYAYRHWAGSRACL